MILFRTRGPNVRVSLHSRTLPSSSITTTREQSISSRTTRTTVCSKPRRNVQLSAAGASCSWHSAPATNRSFTPPTFSYTARLPAHHRRMLMSPHDQDVWIVPATHGGRKIRVTSTTTIAFWCPRWEMARLRTQPTLTLVHATEPLAISARQFLPLDRTARIQERCFVMQLRRCGSVAAAHDEARCSPEAASRTPGHLLLPTLLQAIKDHSLRMKTAQQKNEAAQPLFMYLALHNTHAPLEAPWSYVAPYAVMSCSCYNKSAWRQHQYTLLMLKRRRKSGLKTFTEQLSAAWFPSSTRP